MAIRQIEEFPQVGRHRLIVAGIDRRGRDPARRRIGCIHPRRAAKRIARKLVQQQQQRQCALGRRHPVIEIAARRGLMRIQKRLAKTAIEIRILGEPHRRAGLQPEADHLGRGHGRRLAVAGSQVSAGMKFLFNESFAACRHAPAGGEIDPATTLSSPSKIGAREPPVAAVRSGRQIRNWITVNPVI